MAWGVFIYVGIASVEAQQT